MPIQIERIPLSAQLGAGELALLQDMLATHGRVTLVVPRFATRDVCRRALANAGCGMGIDVTTPDGWIQTLWELLGDGRRLVSGTQRKLLMAQALAAYLAGADGADAPHGLANTPGTIAMLAQAARSYLPAVEQQASSAALTASEQQMVAVLRRYTALLDEHGFIEGAQAATQLAHILQGQAPACARGMVLRGVHDVPPYVLELLGAEARAGDVRVILEREATSEASELAAYFGVSETCDNASAGEMAQAADGAARTARVAEHANVADQTPVPPVPLRCVEVCGPAARDAAYAQLIGAAVAAAAEAGQTDSSHAVAVTAQDPLALFRALAPRLAASNIAATVEARMPFGATRAGQTLAMLSDFLERIDGEEASAWWPAPEIPDWIRSPFSGLSSGASRVVRMLDTRLRKTRNLTKRALLSELESLQSREVNRERTLAERAGRARRPIAVKAVIDALDAHHYAQALQLMAECAAAAPLSAFGNEGLAAKQTELAALEAARAFMDEARSLGVAEDQAFMVLPELSVRMAAYMVPQAECHGAEDAEAAEHAEDAACAGALEQGNEPAPDAGFSVPVVAFCPVDTVAAERPGQRPAVFLLDADAASFPLAERDTPLTLLAEKLGCTGIAAKPAECQRVAFRGVAEAAQVAVFAYVARDRQAEERYPALAYAEAKEMQAAAASAQAAAFAQPIAPDQTATPAQTATAASAPTTTPDQTAAPAQPAAPAQATTNRQAARVLAALDRAIATLPHEGALFANLDLAGGIGAERVVATANGEHVLPPELNGYLLLPERSLGSHTVPRTLSASQIENYLACPYRWLVSNRASTRRLDVEFGPIEMGNFVHDVMQRFHERLIDAGLMRVRPETVDVCLEQMDAAFEEMRADHKRGKYTHGKYAHEERPRAIRSGLVPLDELERNRLESMLPKLHEVVRYEADMLSIFTPAQFEYSFDKEGVTYAGRPLGGRIDRIDTAPSAGNGERFVVIDYKNRATVRELGCADPTMMLEEGETLASAWLPGRDADRAPKVQTLMYAQALERVSGGSAQGAVYFATRGPQVAGAVADALAASEPPAFPHDAVCGYPGVKPPRSRTAKHDGTLGFQQMLDAVEAGITRELDALEQGAIAPNPAADSCTFCPLTMCERRRS